MKTHILLAGLACLSVAAVAQQSNSSDQKTTPPKAQLRESPSKASLGRRESPSKPRDGATLVNVSEDGKAAKAPIGTSIAAVAQALRYQSLLLSCCIADWTNTAPMYATPNSAPKNSGY